MKSRIKEIRIKLELSVDKMAAECDIPASTIYNYESGKRKISCEYVEALMENFDVNPSWIFSGKDNMFISSLQKMISTLNLEQQYKLNNTLNIAYVNDDIDGLNTVLEKYYLFGRLKEKLNSIERSFWGKLIFSERKKNSYTIILGKVLISFDSSFLEKEKIKVEDAKKILENLVSEYQLDLFGDHLKHLLLNEKNDLLKWINQELSDIDAFNILYHSTIVLEILREEMNYLNKKSF